MKLKKRFRPLKNIQAYRCGERFATVKDNGFRLATLTNSPLAKAELINSNLTDYFEQALIISLKNTNQQKPIYGQKNYLKPRKC
jgi:FMN phosphatase YigB (HAD superfamily)